MKKFLFLFAALCCMMVANAQEFEVDGIRYNVTSEDDQTVEVIANNYSGDVPIPATVTNSEGQTEYDVTRIGSNAFQNCTGLTSITIPASVTSIGLHAFQNCTGLTSITIPASVTSIGEYAFSSCTQLATVTFAEGSQLSEIGEYAFCDCSDLSSITILETVTSIGKSAFKSCKSLTSITIPETVTSIGDNAFDSCSKLETITFAKGSELSTIGESAFAGCSALTSITIPASVTTIGAGAFSGCSGLTSVKVFWTEEEMLPALGDNVFAGIGDNPTLYVPSGTKAMYEAADVWKNFETIKQPAPPSNQIWYTTSLDNEPIEFDFDYESNEFDPDIGMFVLQFDDELTQIEESAFLEKATLKSVIIPASVETIGEVAFGDCSSLETVTFTEGSDGPQLSEIGLNAFYGCSSLKSIHIPASVTYIEIGAFGNCGNLNTIIVDKENKCYYSSDENNAIIEKESKTLIAGCKDTVIPEDVTSIGSSAFSGRALTSITIPASVETIGEVAFGDCSSLATVTFADGSQLSAIEASAFKGCSSLTSITIPAGVTTIGEMAFQDCSKLTSITIPETVTSIGMSAFKDCALTSIEIPTGVKTIAYGTFSGCSSLATITFAEDSQLSKIEEFAFFGCAVESINIPETVTSIGMYAFKGCSNLTSVKVFWTESLPTTGSGVFDGIDANATLYVPFGTMALYESADGWKDFTQIVSPEFFKLAVSSAGWASMYLHCAVTIPKYSYDDYWREISVSVYYASEVDGNTITLSGVEAITTITQEEEEEEIIIIPAKTGVIVKVEVDGYVDYDEYEVNFAESDEAGSIEGTNLFEGTSVDKAFNAETDGGVYVLSGASDEGNPQFQEYSGKYLNAFKAYLPMSAVGSGAKEISVVFGETTSINSVNENENENENLYNLNGIRVGSSYKGIVIKNGKKYINK